LTFIVTSATPWFGGGPSAKDAAGAVTSR